MTYFSDGLLDEAEFSALLNDLFRNSSGESYVIDKKDELKVFQIFNQSKVIRILLPITILKCADHAYVVMPICKHTYIRQTDK
jgi:hypothetical protein